MSAVHWEVTHAEHLTKAANDLLADGWEPFAVMPPESGDKDPLYAIIFFRKAATRDRPRE